MKVVIIEDEAPAAARLKKMLAATAVGAAGARSVGPGIEVVAVLDTLAGAKAWMGANPAPDLIFMDIELSDGSSLDLIREVRVGCPVIFVTAYDEYWQEAFEYNGIDYLLKPVKRERLEAALGKFGELKEFFSRRYTELLDFRENAYKSKFLVRRGAEFVPIRLCWLDVCRFELSRCGADAGVRVRSGCCLGCAAPSGIQVCCSIFEHAPRARGGDRPFRGQTSRIAVAICTHAGRLRRVPPAAMGSFVGCSNRAS